MRPNVRLCLRRTTYVKLSVKLVVWLRFTDAEPSLRHRKLVNERFGGP